MEISASDRKIIRDLAEQIREIAEAPRMQQILQRWRDVNALRKPDRAPVWCRPVGCWPELLPQDHLQCTSVDGRRLEYRFRQTLVKCDIGDDEPVEPWLDVGVVFKVQGEHLWGLPIGRQHAQEAGGAWAYDPPLKDPADFEKLRVPQFQIDEAATEQSLDQFAQLLGDTLPVRRVCSPPLGATLGTAAADLRGLTEIMMDMIAAPDIMHKLMATLRDGALNSMDAAEDAGMPVPNTSGPMTASDPIGTPESDGSFTMKNCWCMANSQEFDQVSPEMWEAFCLNYQKPIFERCGLVGYGCCENLTTKIEGVLSIPNLRIFVCSAWTDLAKVLDACQKDYCIMWRQKASDVVFPDDLETIRNDLLDGTRQLQGHSYQIVLRELQTLSGHPRRLHDWTRLAKEAAEQHS